MGHLTHMVNSIRKWYESSPAVKELVQSSESSLQHIQVCPQGVGPVWVGVGVGVDVGAGVWVCACVCMCASNTYVAGARSSEALSSFHLPSPPHLSFRNG